VSRDQKVICADWLSSIFQFRSDVAIFNIGRTFERKNVDLREQILDGFKQTFRAFLGAAIAQFGRYDDARADIIFANSGDTLRGFALGWGS
jgi:hypothetical protein